MSGYWFYHEYLDEQRRFRIHRIDTNTETEARKLHRHACNFHWVTQHNEPSVSALFTANGPTQRTLISGHRPDQTYSTTFTPIPCPEPIRQQLTKTRHETTLP